MKIAIRMAFVLLIGIVIGCCWNFYKYEPLKLVEKNWKLEVDLNLLNMAYVRDISGGFIDEDAYKIIR